MGRCTTCGGTGKITFKTSGGNSKPEDCYECLGTGKSKDRITNTDTSDHRKKMFDTALEEKRRKWANEDLEW